MKVARFTNLMDSNCYVLELSGRCILVDPGCENVSVIEEYLASVNLQLDYVILTHEHIDHVQGAAALCDRYNATAIATEECLAALSDPQLNLSAVYPGVSPTDYTPHRIQSVEKLNFELIWSGVEIKFYATPGHCSGAMCFTIGNLLFSGDTLLEKIKTYTTAPSSSVVQLCESLKMIRNDFCEDLFVYPGHEASFRLGSVFPFIDAQIRLLERKIARL